MWISVTEVYAINHIGLAVPSIGDFLAKNALIYADLKMVRTLENETQGVREAFFTDGRTLIELLEPLNATSPLAGFLRQHPTGGLVHICYDCDDIKVSIKELQEHCNAKLVSGPTPDVAFDGRPIAFLFIAGQLIELVQR